VYARGGVAADESYRCEPDSLFFLFSAGKPLVALGVHLLAERGQLSLDDPVAAHWPNFGRRGKQRITIRHVLQHRGGLPVARGMPINALRMTDWTASVRAIERATVAYPPGEVSAYHILTFGFILGEVVQRVTGRPVRDFLRDELLVPLGLDRDIYVGLPPDRWDRHVPVGGGGYAPMGSLASRTAFGHNGSYACLGWADPERQIAMAYLTSRLVSRSAGARHMSAVSDAVLTAFR
jgi:CubicO group peptidase (beta-lactamase class C family)